MNAKPDDLQFLQTCKTSGIKLSTCDGDETPLVSVRSNLTGAGHNAAALRQDSSKKQPLANHPLHLCSSGLLPLQVVFLEDDLAVSVVTPHSAGPLQAG